MEEIIHNHQQYLFGKTQTMLFENVILKCRNTSFKMQKLNVRAQFIWCGYFHGGLD